MFTFLLVSGSISVFFTVIGLNFLIFKKKKKKLLPDFKATSLVLQVFQDLAGRGLLDSSFFFPPFAVVPRGEGSVCATIFAGAQFLTHVLRAPCALTLHSAHFRYTHGDIPSHFDTFWLVCEVLQWEQIALHPLLAWPLQEVSSLLTDSGPLLNKVFLGVAASLSLCWPPLINLWGTLSGSKSHPQSSLFTGLVVVCAKSLCTWGPCTAVVIIFREKSPWVLPTVPNKHLAFHTDHLSDQSRVYLGQGQSWPHSSSSSRFHWDPQFLSHCPSLRPLPQPGYTAGFVSLTAFLSPQWL